MDISTVSNGSPRWDHADRRRFRVKHALRSLEDALTLLRTKPADGVEVAALERVRDDLAIVLRLAEAECRGDVACDVAFRPSRLGRFGRLRRWPGASGSKVAL